MSIAIFGLGLLILILGIIVSIRKRQPVLICILLLQWLILSSTVVNFFEIEERNERVDNEIHRCTLK